MKKIIINLFFIFFLGLSIIPTTINAAGCCECRQQTLEKKDDNFYWKNYCLKQGSKEIKNSDDCLEICAQTYAVDIFDKNNPPNGYPKYSDKCDNNDCPISKGNCCVLTEMKDEKEIVKECIDNISKKSCKEKRVENNGKITTEAHIYGTGLLSCNDWCDEHKGKQLTADVGSDIKQSTDMPPADPINFKPQVTIPGTIKVGGKNFTVKKGEGIIVDGVLLAKYISLLFKWLVGVVGFVAVAYLAFGGMQWLAAMGNSEGINKAKETIRNSILGMLLAFISYGLLYLINPALVGFNKLDITPIKGRALRVGLLNNPEALNMSEKYKQMNCPSQQELKKGIDFFITGYYKPAYGDKEAYESFWCNIAMQCSCPNGRSNITKCSNGKKTWQPCNEFDKSVEYCNHTSSGNKPQRLITAAVSNCLPRGTKFKISGAKVQDVNNVIWTAEDSGGWIKGKRIDLFMGEGHNAYLDALKITGVVTVQVCPGGNCP